jgi:protein tyrosine phosphatase type 4A
MDPYDAIELIRKKRRGAINAKQLKFIESYRRRTGTTCSCVIM